MGNLSRNGLFEAGQAVGRGPPAGQPVVVVDEPGQRVLHAPEGRGDLHQFAELDRAAEEAWRCHYEREHHRGLAKAVGEPGQALLRGEQAQVVADHLAEAPVELVALHRFALVQGDGLAVFAHPHHVVAKVGFHALLLEVQRNQRAADVMGEHAADHAVQHRHPDHESRNFVTGAVELEVERAAQPPKNADETGQRHQGVQQAHAQRHRIRGEQVQVFLDALVGVVGRVALAGGPLGLGEPGQLHPVEGMVGQPARGVVAGQPGTPAQFQQLRQVELVDGDDDVGKGDPGEAPELGPEDVLLLVLQGVVEQAVPVVDQHQHVHGGQVEHDDGCEQGAGFPLLLGSEIRHGQRAGLTREGPEGGELVDEAHGRGSRSESES